MIGVRDREKPQQRFHTADKKWWGEWLGLHVVIEPALRRAFGGVYAYVHPAALRLRGERARVPVIFCLTHSGWWDGYLAFVLNDRIFHHDLYLMMEEIHLKRYWFFTWVGVFGIDRDDARKALGSIEYITGVLKQGRGRALWMFPQGTMAHPDAQPLKIYGGAANIARRLGRCAIMPVALRYDFLMQQSPDAFARVGAPLMLDYERERTGSKDLTARLAEAMTRTADELRADVISYNTRHYRRLMAGRGSINQVWDSVVRLAHRGQGSRVRGQGPDEER